MNKPNQSFAITLTFKQQAVRRAVHKQCRCHGLSGTCQFQTCWDRLSGFDSISGHLKYAYVNSATKVRVINNGTHESPDLLLVRQVDSADGGSILEFGSEGTRAKYPFPEKSPRNRISSEELIYLYDSPDYCHPSRSTGHLGTRGRPCKLAGHGGIAHNHNRSTIPTNISTLGFCEELCCNRNYSSRLVLEVVQCNCEFRFCCSIECESCLHQHFEHHCS